MKGTKKTAYQAAALERLRNEMRELQSELRAAELELAHKDRMLEEKETAYQQLKALHEKFMFSYSEKVEALEEAARAYKSIAEEARHAHKTFRQEAEAEIAAMRKQNREG